MLHYLAKTAQNLASIFGDKSDRIDKPTLEELLIEADIDYDLIELMLENLPKYPSRAQLGEQLSRLFDSLDSGSSSLETIITSSPESKPPTIDLIIGVNGAGKTTTIAKLARFYLDRGESVLLGAGDTFRAAAIEQLKLWAQKLQIPIIATQQGSDPSALAFDAIQSGLARSMQHIIIDTAGRLHNQENLKKELEKIDRVCAKAIQSPEATQALSSKLQAHLRKILVLDGTQGSSALSQAKVFSQSVAVDGVIVTKLDGTSKGGVILSIAHSLQIPILFLGVGEREGDFIPFDREAYIQGLLDCLFINER
ncbi:signal recognition particle-docking protein FtsY [Helicobacter sp.]|uniref:signal recognition particle-docking protein FtsY n=1 Tax=Helicobacter sp. TaxID=218 RepID=UPI00388FC13C